jgi:hypothetical protein
MMLLRRPPTRSSLPGRFDPSARTVGVVAAVVTVATAICALLLAGGAVHLHPSATARLPGASTLSAGLALALVVVLPMAVTAAAGWHGSARTGDLAALAGAALIGASLVPFQVLRSLSWLLAAGLLIGAALVVMGLLMPGSPSGSEDGSQ